MVTAHIMGQTGTTGRTGTRPSGSFRELCAAHGIAVTHQRQVLFEVMQSIPGHPSPEEVYELVQARIPSISLATVYKNIHLFIASGLFREVSLHHGSLRVEMNDRPHHHMVCTRCKAIFDLDLDLDVELGVTAETEQADGRSQARQLPNGFVAERYSVDVLGRCAACQDAE